MPLESPGDPWIGRALGSYRVEAVLGRGGMGTVYRATDTSTGRAVALKALLPELAESPEIRSRFEREASASGFLSHPNIVDVYELGATPDGSLYLTMELIAGSPLAAALDGGALHPRRALIIARQVLLGLARAHQHGLVHRDLKPENIMLARAGEAGREYEQVKLLDFGVVKLISDAAGTFGWEKLTRTGITFGTPAYMAPEQALGRALDGRADLYSLGVVVFEMLTGRRPFAAEDNMALLRKHIGEAPPALADARPGAPWATAAMESLIARALAKSPADRFADARDMSAAIEGAFVSIDHVPE